MKPKSTLRSFLLLAGSTLLAISYSHAAVYYWDNDGTTPGFGTAGGTWDAPTVSQWSASSAGTATPEASLTTATTDSLNFGYLSTGLGAGTITVNSTVDAGNLTFASGSGAIVLSGGTLNLAAASTITVNNASDTIESVLQGAATSLTKAGTGTLIFSGTNTYTGTTTIKGGVLRLDFSAVAAPASNIINSGSALSLGGGQLTVTGKASTINSQTFASTSITAGANTLANNANATANPQLVALGGITRSVGSTVNFSLPTGTAGVTNGFTTSTSDTNGILGGGVIVGAVGTGNNPTWATNNGTNIVGLAAASYTTTATAGITAANYAAVNIDVTTSEGLLDGVITPNSLRFNLAGARTVTLADGDNIIQSGGILVGSTVGANVSTITGGNLAGSASGDLVVYQNNSTGSANGLTIASLVQNNGGATALTKSGTGWLTLTNDSNSYSGGTIINAGTVSIAADARLGDTAGDITFGGRGTLAMNNGTSLGADRTITANAGVIGSLQSPNGANANHVVGVAGQLTGDGGFSVRAGYQLGSLTLNATNTGNDFKGDLVIGRSADFDGVLSTATLNIASLTDGAGYGNIIFGRGNNAAGNTMTFNWSNSATGALTLNNRQIQLDGAVESAVFANNSSDSAETITVNTDLLVSRAGAKTFTLGGSNTGANTFAGDISNGLGTVTIAKTGAANWNITGDMSQTGGISAGGPGTLNLSGTNTYSGNTTLSFSNPGNGFLVFQGIQALSNNTSFVQTHAGGSGTHNTLKILDDSATPASRSGVNLTFNHSNNSKNALSVFVGNNNTANGGTSASTQAGSTIQLGNMNFNQTAVGQTAGTLLSVTGANGYKLQIGDVNIALQAAFAGNWGVELRADAALTVGGNVQQATGSAGTTTLQLGGGANGSLISGNILDADDGKALSLTKTNAASVWTLTGTNTYTGATTISGGTLLVNSPGSLASASAVAVNGTSTLGGTGTINGSVTVAAAGNVAPGASVGTLTIGGGLDISAMAGGAGTLNYELNTIAASDKITVGGTLDIGAAALGLGDFSFTDLGGLQNGTYKLIETGSAITGTLAGDTNGTLGVATIDLQISGDGTDIELVVSGLGGGTPYENWAGGAAFDADANGDGVENGMAFLLGAASPTSAVTLPTVTQSGGGLTLTFNMRNAAARGTASLNVQHSSDLGIADAWESALTPDTDSTVNDVVFDITAGDPLNGVVATIPVGKAASGKLFGRLKGQP